MLSNFVDQFRRMMSGDADGAASQHRRESVAVAVAWWVASLRNSNGVDPAALDLFETALTADLIKRLDSTYRVYLEVNHQPKGILRSVALETGLDVESFPTGTTMSVSDTKVALSRSAQAPYEILYGKEDDR